MEANKVTRKTLMILMTICAVAAWAAPRAYAAPCGVPVPVQIFTSTPITGCPDGRPVTAYAFSYDFPETVNSGALDIVCEAYNPPPPLGTGNCSQIPGPPANAAGDGLDQVTVETDWSSPGMNGCINGQRVVIVLTCNDGTGAKLSLAGSDGGFGYEVELAFEYDAAADSVFPLSLKHTFDMTSRTFNNGRPEVLGVIRSGGNDVVNVNVPTPGEWQTDCSPGTLGEFINSVDGGLLGCPFDPVQDRGRLFQSTQFCFSAAHPRPNTSLGQYCVGGTGTAATVGAVCSPTTLCGSTGVCTSGTKCAGGLPGANNGVPCATSATCTNGGICTGRSMQCVGGPTPGDPCVSNSPTVACVGGAFNGASCVAPAPGVSGPGRCVGGPTPGATCNTTPAPNTCGTGGSCQTGNNSCLADSFGQHGICASDTCGVGGACTANPDWLMSPNQAGPVTIPTPATGMCNFLGTTSNVQTKDSGTIDTFSIVGGPDAASPMAQSVRAGKKGNSIEVSFSTSSELGLAGFNVLTDTKGKGELKLNAALVPAKGVGGAGASYTLSFPIGDFKGGRSIIVESVLTNGTTLRAPKVNF